MFECTTFLRVLATTLFYIVVNGIPVTLAASVPLPDRDTTSSLVTIIIPTPSSLALSPPPSATTTISSTPTVAGDHFSASSSSSSTISTLGFLLSTSSSATSYISASSSTSTLQLSATHHASLSHTIMPVILGIILSLFAIIIIFSIRFVILRRRRRALAAAQPAEPWTVLTHGGAEFSLDPRTSTPMPGSLGSPSDESASKPKAIDPTNYMLQTVKLPTSDSEVSVVTRGDSVLLPEVSDPVLESK